MTNQDRNNAEQRTDAELTEVTIPNKRYFAIGEVGQLCSVKSHVLRYWEQEFSQLKPIKRRGNRRYYQRHDIELIRLIRTLLYDLGFTIAGARQQLSHLPRINSREPAALITAIEQMHQKLKQDATTPLATQSESHSQPEQPATTHNSQELAQVQQRLEAIQQRLAAFIRVT